MSTDAPIRVLCVDDEPNVLDGLRRHLRQGFDVDTAEGSGEGLQMVEESGPFAVVISDLRMPGMDGIEFLSRVREHSPDTARVLLTGNADLRSAIAAVNEGQLFRFLTKPCPPKVLLPAVQAAADHHRLVTAERVLLEQTLLGSVKMLTEILALANPAAFGRASRAKQLAGAVADRLGEPARWQMEMAAMLSQVACIALPGTTAEKLHKGQELTSPEQAMVDRLPEVTEKLLAEIPRIDPVRAILAHRERRFFGAAPTPADAGAAGPIPAGARILKAVLDLDALTCQGVPLDAGLETLRSRSGWYDPDVLRALSQPANEPEVQEEIQELPLRELRTGMVLMDDVQASDDRLLVAHGQEVSPGLLERLRNFSENVGVKEPLRVLAPIRPDDDGTPRA